MFISRLKFRKNLEKFDKKNQKMVASNLNTGNETRITRRIIAEDNDWTLQTVPYLRTMALETIIQNWEEHPHLDELSEKERRKVLSKLRHRFKFIFNIHME